MMDFEASHKPKFCGSNCDVSVETMDTTTVPVKRLFDNNNSSNISVKKLKASIDKDEDHIPSSKINKRSGKSA